ncbi:MAG: ORF6N domain-containing protein [Chitinispirillaceae bacterium]|nr:ORF6N domain-containing protein [Chitinispirillaceae bacterium]
MKDTLENKNVFPPARIESLIISIRGQKVILDSNLAALYGVTTKRLNEQLKRNIHRFPDDFMFKLTVQEHSFLRSQNATSKLHGGNRYLPKAFTEHGALMVANITDAVAMVRVFENHEKKMITYNKRSDYDHWIRNYQQGEAWKETINH